MSNHKPTLNLQPARTQAREYCNAYEGYGAAGRISTRNVTIA